MPELSRNQLIASAAATLEVMEVLGTSSHPLGLAQIVAAVGRPKGSVHRMVSTLVNTGFAEQEPRTGRYGLTLKAWRVGARAAQRIDIVERTRTVLERLRDDTRETVHLAVFDPPGHVIYVAKLASPRSIGVQTYLGQLSPAWCTATGRALLAFRPDDLDRVLAQPLEQRTPYTVTDPVRLRALLAEVREQGYALTRAENHPEMAGLAAPVRDHEGRVAASVGLAVPEYRVTAEVLQALVPRVLRAAGEASAAIGHEMPSPRPRSRRA
jgi:IclR family KDG regulon transcriptional repressor